MPHTEAPVHIPEGYIASLTDQDRSEFRKMFASTSEADREEIRNHDQEEWEAFSELHWQLVQYDEEQEERALSKRDQIALHVSRRCRPLSAIFEVDEENKRQSVLSMLPAMDSYAEEVASPTSAAVPALPASPLTPANLHSPTPYPLASHPPEVSEPLDDDDIPSISDSNNESFGTSPFSVRKTVRQSVERRLGRFAARAKNFVKSSKC